MPANLTPQYLKAEQVYKEARTAEDKIAALEEMLAVIPKHKGTDHLQADLRRRLSRLREEATKPKAKKAYDPFRLEKGGAGQVVLLGAPNAGKSAVVLRLSNAPTQSTPFPFATQGPVPGMMAFEDVQVQLVDLPPITAEFFPKGMMGLIKGADGALLVGDLAAESVLDDLEAILRALDEGRVDLLDPELPPPAAPAQEGEEEAVPSRLRTRLPAMLLASKADAPGAADRLALLWELFADRFAPVTLSTVTGEGFDELPGRVFRMLDRIRVYSKEPGKPPDMTQPFVLKRGSTVLDLAARIHRDFPDHLREARIWGSARFGGQAVQRDHVLVEKDIVELHVKL